MPSEAAPKPAPDEDSEAMTNGPGGGDGSEPPLPHAVSPTSNESPSIRAAVRMIINFPCLSSTVRHSAIQLPSDVSPLSTGELTSRRQRIRG